MAEPLCARLERGNLSGVSDSVLNAIARALQLDEAERSHLYDLARAANTSTPARRRPARQQIRPGVRTLLDAMTDAPAFVRNGRLDVLAVNRLGEALYAPAFDTPDRPVNLARFCFLDPRADDFYPNWDDAADTTVALLRTEAGRDPYDRSLTDLVGQLATRSDEFRTRWAAHDVRLHHTGVKRFAHPVVGRLDLAFEAMPLPADPGLTLTAYNAVLTVGQGTRRSALGRADRAVHSGRRCQILRPGRRQAGRGRHRESGRSP
jgi:hypothetical protein